jgi:hypothetical protein
MKIIFNLNLGYLETEADSSSAEREMELLCIF